MPHGQDVDTQRIAADRKSPSKPADLLPMHRLLRPVLLAAAALTFPAAAQTPPTQGWPANRAPPAPAQTTPTPATPPAAAAPAPAPPLASGPVPLPFWFSEIDTAKKGEVSRADFLKYRMKT